MTKQADSAGDFWRHPYVITLSPMGKLSLYYAMSHDFDKQPIILEDMALATGQDMPTCEQWLDQFIADGIVDMEGV